MASPVFFAHVGTHTSPRFELDTELGRTTTWRGRGELPIGLDVKLGGGVVGEVGSGELHALGHFNVAGNWMRLLTEPVEPSEGESNLDPSIEDPSDITELNEGLVGGGITLGGSADVEGSGFHIGGDLSFDVAASILGNSAGQLYTFDYNTPTDISGANKPKAAWALRLAPKLTVGHKNVRFAIGPTFDWRLASSAMRQISAGRVVAGADWTHAGASGTDAYGSAWLAGLETDGAAPAVGIEGAIVIYGF